MICENDLWVSTKKHMNDDLVSPSYVFDIDVFKSTVDTIRKVLTRCSKLCYAMKANPFLVEFADDFIDRFEVCSPGEYEICDKHGINPEKIIVSGVNKTFDSMERIMSLNKGAGIFTVESMQHYNILSSLAKEKNLNIKLMIRLTSGNQFGVDEDTVEKIFDINRDNEHCKIVGIHYFSGTQKKLKKIEKELISLDEFAKKLKEKFSIDELELEYGPGLSVDYFGSDKIPTANEQLSDLNVLLNNLTNFDSIGIEMGRFMAADCGCFITQVDDIKNNHDENFVILDSGIHQINYFGQMMGMKIPPIKQFNLSESNETEKYTLCGALCTTNDILVREINLQKLNIGDKLLFQRCGGYSMTECSAMFLSRDLPTVYAYSDKMGYVLLRERFETFNLNTNI